MAQYYNTMLLPQRILFGFSFVITELPEKISSITLNVFSKTSPEESRSVKTPGEYSCSKFKDIF